MAYPGDSINLEQPNSTTRRGRVGKGVAQTLTCSCNQAVVEPKIIEICKINKNRNSSVMNSVVDINGISACLDTMQGGNRQPKILEPNELNCIGLLDIKGNEQIRRVYDDDDGICPTLSTMQGGNREPKVYTQYRIRKLTARECGRLMGFSDKVIDKIIAAGISESGMYKMFGNSIVVDVLRCIWRSWLYEGEIEYEVGEQLSII